MMGLWIILMVLGAAAVWVGRRGFRAGHHPHCVACDFDLYNLPEETKRCPECGAFIRVEEAVRLGKRRPVQSLVAVGILMIVIGGALGVMAGLHWWPSWNASRFKTVAWLESDIHAPEERTRQQASAELVRRIQAGTLSDAQLEEVTARVLKLQADSSITWNTAWGDVVQAARGTGRLSTGSWKKYLEQAVQVNVRVRPRVRMDDPVPLEVDCTLRGGSDYRQFAPGKLVPRVEVTMLGEKVELRAQAGALDVIPLPLHWLLHWLPGEPWPAEMRQAGTQKVHLVARVELTDRAGEMAVSTRAVDMLVEILPVTEASVKLGTVKEGMEAEMNSAVRLRTAGETLVPTTQKPVGTLWIGAPPMAASFRVVLRQGSREWLLARMLVRTNDALSVPLTFPATGEMLQEGPAEIVCVPEVQGAVGTVEVLEIWPTEIARQIRLGASRDRK